MDWMGIIASELAEKEEMSSLAVGFAVWMHKWAAGLDGETTQDLVGNGRGGLLQMKSLRRTEQ